MKVMLDPGATMPTRAHETDAGLDLYCINGGILWPFGHRTFDTGVHIELPPGTWGKIESKSGLNVRRNVVSCGGTIDEGYTGSIAVKLYNLGFLRGESKTVTRLHRLLLRNVSSRRWNGQTVLKKQNVETTDSGARGADGKTDRTRTADERMAEQAWTA